MLGEEPEEGEDVTTIMFRTQASRLQRRFLKQSPVQVLFDYIDTRDPEELGQEEEGSFKYELVLPPMPKVKVLEDRTKTLQEEGLVPRALVNIKQL